MKYQATKRGVGHYDYRGFEIIHGYDVLGDHAWLVMVDMGTLSFATLTAAKMYVDQRHVMRCYSCGTTTWDHTIGCYA